MRLEKNGVKSSQSAVAGAGGNPSNGSKSEANGNGAAKNGSAKSEMGSNASSFSMLQPLRSDYFGHDREEVARILIQALVDLGYHKAAETLEEESEYTLESPDVSDFRRAVLSGDWSRAEYLLSSLEVHGDADINALLFAMRQQKFLETLEARDVSRALYVLRNEITPLNQSVERLHALSSFMLCYSDTDLKEQANWDGASGTSRQDLLSELSKSISPSIMIPEHRLASLLQQVKQTQISKCLYHNTANSPSLYADHICDKNEFPSTTVKILNAHEDEVWFVRFSPDGTRLATASSDNTVIIWDLESFEARYTFREHTAPVTCVQWSPDSLHLLSCAQDNTAKLWDTETGQCIRTLKAHTAFVSSCAWAPDGQSFVTGSMDLNMILWDIDGNIKHKWTGSRIYDMTITPDGKRLVAICTNKKLHVYNFATKEKEYEWTMDCELTCISASKDPRYILVSMGIQEVQLLDIERAEVTRRFIGQKQGEFMIRSCFGGADENFIVSGSEDSNVYVWHKENGTLVLKLPGHVGTVNCVAWNPKNPHMFASAGDDHAVRIWSRAAQPSLKGKMKGILNDGGFKFRLR
ncbi:hypothetical protein RUND412_002109 [Rhizina undulata]